MKKNLGRNCSLLFGFVLFFDLLTKYLIQFFQIRTNTKIIDVTYQTNTGTMFSLLSGTQFVNLIFIILSIVAIVLLYFYWKSEKKYSYQLALIVAGITGNLINRIFNGYVIDWINLNIWPVFNIADSAIVVGVIWLIVILIKEKD